METALFVAISFRYSLPLLLSLFCRESNQEQHRRERASVGWLSIG